jgi:hypothetical protein
MRLKILKLDALVIAAITVAVLVGAAAVVGVFRSTPIVVDNSGTPATGKVSPLTGEHCTGSSSRPIAVMLGSDPEARPLSGIGGADLVFEMPVTPNGITRMMAVYQCNNPTEIGSVRSARADFIPLSQGLGALLAHWGGEAGALQKLNAHVTDNVDALLYEGSTFYRKSGIPKPHNGFTTLALVRSRAALLGYTASSSTPAFPHLATEPLPNIADIVDHVSVQWPQGMDVEFRYDTSTGRYLRFRGGQPEMDAATKTQVTVRVVVVMSTDAKFLLDQYISVRTIGQGVAAIYQDGQRTNALWKKSTATDPLRFTDENGKPIPLAVGPLWVLIDAPLPQPN